MSMFTKLGGFSLLHGQQLYVISKLGVCVQRWVHNDFFLFVLSFCCHEWDGRGFLHIA